MADDSQQRPEQNTSIERDAEIAWRQEQFAKAKMAMRGMLSKDFGSGGGEFLEPVQSGQPVQQYYPDDMALLAMASSESFVSADPQIASIEQPPSIVPQSEGSPVQESDMPSFETGAGMEVQSTDPTEIQKPVVDDPGLQDFSVPKLPQDDSGPSTIESAPEVSFEAPEPPDNRVKQDLFSKPSLADIKPPEPPVEPGLPDPGKLWPPGAGRAGTEEERAQVKQKATEASGGGGQDGPRDPSSTPPPKFLDGRGQVEIPQVDWGDMGQRLEGSQDATQNAHSEAVKLAADSVGFAGENAIAVLRQIASMLIRFGNELGEIRDRLDSEDQPDTW